LLLAVIIEAVVSTRDNEVIDSVTEPLFNYFAVLGKYDVVYAAVE